MAIGFFWNDKTPSILRTALPSPPDPVFAKVDIACFSSFNDVQVVDNCQNPISLSQQKVYCSIQQHKLSKAINRKFKFSLLFHSLWFLVQQAGPEATWIGISTSRSPEATALGFGATVLRPVRCIRSVQTNHAQRHWQFLMAQPLAIRHSRMVESQRTTKKCFHDIHDKNLGERPVIAEKRFIPSPTLSFVKMVSGTELDYKSRKHNDVLA